jgi:hypothetical protein
MLSLVPLLEVELALNRYFQIFRVLNYDIPRMVPLNHWTNYKSGILSICMLPLYLTLSLDLNVLKTVPAGLQVAFKSIAPINAIPIGVKSISIDNVCFGDPKLETVCFKDWKKSQSLSKITIGTCHGECTVTSMVSRYKQVC